MLIVLHTTIAVIAVVLLILVPKIDPLFALVLGAIYLGLAAGLGFQGTLDALATGFGDIMADVGLLVGFGVLLGALLNSLGALQKAVDKLVSIFGPKRLPYGFGVALSVIFPSIFTDTQVVLGAPMVRSSALRMGHNGLAMMGGTLTVGALVGNFLVVPGLGTILIAGMLGAPLGMMLIYGFIVGPATVVLTIFIYGLLLKRGLWNKAKDEDVAEYAPEAAQGTRPGSGTPGGANGETTGASMSNTTAGERLAGRESSVAVAERQDARSLPPLHVSLLPIMLPLLLIATGAITHAVGVESEVIGFIGNPIFALFLGLFGAYLLARRALGSEQVGESMTRGFNASGKILLITGVGGAFGSIISATGLDSVLVSFFSINSTMPAAVIIILSWFVAALLHVAIGSTGVAAIAAAGILAPIVGGLEVPVELIGLAIGSGVLFAVHVNANLFWMFKSLVGLSTRGALKSHTLVTALTSVVSLGIILVLSLIV